MNSKIKIKIQLHNPKTLYFKQSDTSDEDPPPEPVLFSYTGTSPQVNLSKDLTNSLYSKTFLKVNRTTQYKISQKGAISFYGIRRFPITLYFDELKTIMNTCMKSVDFSDDFVKFLEYNNMV